MTFTPGQRVMDVDSERIGIVKSVDYGGVHVEFEPTDTEGREVRVCRPDSLLAEQGGR